LNVLWKDLAVPLTAPTGIFGGPQVLGIWGAGVNNQYPAIQFSSTGNGTIAVVLRILIQAGRQMTTTESLIGIKIPIIRV